MIRVSSPCSAGVLKVIISALTLMVCTPGWSETLTTNQLTRRTWFEGDGSTIPQDILVQSPDGTLWLGGNGLRRFDGVRFVRYPEPGDMPLPSSAIKALAPGPDGTLWIGFRFGGVAQLRHGQVVAYGENDGLPEGSVEDLAWGPDGRLWAATTRGLLEFDSKRWNRVAPQAIPQAAWAVFCDSSGNLWVMTSDRVLVRTARDPNFRQIASGSGQPNLRPVFSMARDRSVWAWTTDGLTRMVVLPDGTFKTSHMSVDGAAPPLLFDRDDRLWLGGDNIQLVADPHSGEGATPPAATTLPATTPDNFLSDREGNVWVITSEGIERFSPTDVLKLSLPKCTAGWNHAIAGRPASSTVWITCGGDPHRPRGATEIQAGEPVAWRGDVPGFSASYGAPDGVVWFGGRAGIGRIETDGTVSMIASPDEARGGEIQAIALDQRGELWVSVVYHGLFRLSGGVWSRNGGLKDLPPSAAVVASVDADGGIWFGYTQDRIAHVQNDQVKWFGKPDGLSVGNVTALTIHGHHMWVGGDQRFQSFDGTRFHTITAISDNPFTGLTGILETPTGDLWLNGDRGIIHVSYTDAQRVLHSPDARVAFRLLDEFDGVGHATSLRPIPSALQTANGQLWFLNNKEVLQIDPARSTYNTLPPPVTIWSITSNGVRHPAQESEITLPVDSSQIQIEYTAGSLVTPERVKFRYKLDGLEHEWQDGRARREAFYTNLPPGHYVFSVMAANNDGVWNPKAATVRFLIVPAFYQTTWFRLLWICALLTVLTLLYHLRMRQMSAQVLARLAERLGERDRIARELHDTLLQGVQGLILRFQAVADTIPSREPAHDAMEKTLERADRLLSESRTRVKDLRNSSSFSHVSLPQTLASEGEQMALIYPAKFMMRTDREAHPLHPIVGEEVLLIAREALFNAFQHAQASHIEVDVYHGEAELIVRVRDDGRGIGAETMRGGAATDHYGLVGMRERATKIRGRLAMWSAVGAGTEIDLRVPATVAYNKPLSPILRSWWRAKSRDVLKKPCSRPAAWD